jgi:hypothetical protein
MTTIYRFIMAIRVSRLVDDLTRDDSATVDRAVAKLRRMLANGKVWLTRRVIDGIDPLLSRDYRVPFRWRRNAARVLLDMEGKPDDYLPEFLLVDAFDDAGNRVFGRRWDFELSEDLM